MEERYIEREFLWLKSKRDITGCDKNVSLFSLWLYLVYRNSLVIGFMYVLF